MTIRNLASMSALMISAALYLVACTTLESVPNAGVESLLNDANSTYQSGSYAQAGELYEQIANRKDLPKWQRRSAAYNSACAYALSDGQRDQALDLLDQAATLGFINVDLLRSDADLNSLRTEPRWAPISARIERASEREVRRWGATALQTPYSDKLATSDKLAGLALLWSEAKYNFVNFDLVPELDWDAEYLAMIPRVIESETTYDYYRLLQFFIAKLEDGHANVYFPNDPEFNRGRFHVPAITFAWIEERLVLDIVPGEEFISAGVKRGDEIIAVDGQPINEFADSERRPFVSGSVKENIDANVYSWRLFTGRQGPINFTIRKQTGGTVTVQSERPDWPVWNKLMEGVEQQPPNFRWKMLPQNIAYVELNSFSTSEASRGFSDNFVEISKAKGLILDVRRNGGGSSGYGYSILSRLTREPFAVSAWRTLNYRPAYRAWGYPTESYHSKNNTEAPHPDNYYSGPVAVLSGPESFSATEDFLAAFDVMNRGPIIGMPSGGSTGQPLPISLPGGGTARITAKRDTYPDGSDFIGVGVQPDIRVARTISSFIARRDNVLEAAIKYIAEVNQQQ